MKYRIYNDDMLGYIEFEDPLETWEYSKKRKLETGKSVDIYLMTNPPACIATDDYILWTNLADTMDKSEECIDMVNALIAVIPDPKICGSAESLPTWGLDTDVYMPMEKMYEK